MVTAKVRILSAGRGRQDDRMGWEKMGKGDGDEASSCKSCASCLRGRRRQDGRMTGWGGRRWEGETVTRRHPVNPVHPVCGEKRTGWQDDRMGWEKMGKGDGDEASSCKSCASCLRGEEDRMAG